MVSVRWGPWLVTADSVQDDSALHLWLEVDGRRYQDSSTAQMVFKPAFLVSYLSRFMSLQPGDVISTGTPPGVGMGMKPPVYLGAGQVVRLGSMASELKLSAWWRTAEDVVAKTHVRPRAGRHAIGQCGNPVDENIVYSGGRRRRLFERRRVANRDGVKHANVCVHSDGQPPAVMQAKVMGPTGRSCDERHFPATALPVHERTARARVETFPTGGDADVASSGSPSEPTMALGRGEDPRDIGLVHQEVDGTGGLQLRYGLELAYTRGLPAMSSRYCAQNSGCGSHQ